jgi:hypothetical protein
MNRQEQKIFWGGVFVLILLFNIAIWPLLALLAWYVKRIPDKRLPMAALLSGNQKRFYDWLSDFFIELAQVRHHSDSYWSHLGGYRWGAVVCVNASAVFCPRPTLASAFFSVSVLCDSRYSDAPCFA